MVANKGTVWAAAEVEALIDIWRAEDIEAQLEGVHRNLPIYERVAELLNLRGFDRTGEQMSLQNEIVEARLSQRQDH